MSQVIITRHFCRHSKAWYADEHTTPEISIIVDVDDNRYEFMVEWTLADTLTASLRFYSDSWPVFPYIQDLIDSLQTDKTELEMAQLLGSLGFIDTTPYKVDVSFRSIPTNGEDKS